jgi:hypothetical protein
MTERLDPIKEAKAVQALRESMAAAFADDDDLLLDTIEGETGLFEAIDKLLLSIHLDAGAAKGIQKAMSDLDLRAGRLEKRAETARALIEQAMMLAELDKIERPTATLSLVRRAAKVEITEEAEIPAEFWKAGDPKLDKKALGQALKDGQAVPGAALSNQAPSLTIRVL